MKNIAIRPGFRSWSVLALLVFALAGAYGDSLALAPGNTYLEYDESRGELILSVKAGPGLGSILITESSADPAGELDVYAFRADGPNPVNGGERRILDGEFLDNELPASFLVDSTPQPDPVFGEAFRILIPRNLSYGYPGTRSGEVSVGPGTWINIRTFEKPYADYSGSWQDNPFIISTGGAVVDDEGFTRDITEMVPPEILDSLEDLGMVIHTGNDPPNLEGTYLTSPNVLVSSSIESDTPGDQYADYHYTFRNQDNNRLTIEVVTESLNGSQSIGRGLGGFIVGDDGRFSIFVETREQSDDGTSRTVDVISGELTEDGIVHWQNSLVMLEHDNELVYIDVGEGRLFEDGDGISEKVN